MGWRLDTGLVRDLLIFLIYYLLDHLSIYLLHEEEKKIGTKM